MHECTPAASSGGDNAAHTLTRPYITGCVHRIVLTCKPTAFSPLSAASAPLQPPPPSHATILQTHRRRPPPLELQSERDRGGGALLFRQSLCEPSPHLQRDQGRLGKGGLDDACRKQQEAASHLSPLLTVRTEKCKQARGCEENSVHECGAVACVRQRARRGGSLAHHLRYEGNLFKVSPDPLSQLVRAVAGILRHERDKAVGPGAAARRRRLLHLHQSEDTICRTESLWLASIS